MKIQLVIALLATIGSLHAQTVLGTITGRALDPSGAIVVNAALTATHAGTSVAYRTKTNEAGNYVLQQLPLGSYEVTIDRRLPCAESAFRKLLPHSARLGRL